MKKVYVCYFAFDYEGCSEPEVAFEDEKDAKNWAEQAFLLGAGGVLYKELEVK